jgi:hypothetical protein
MPPNYRCTLIFNGNFVPLVGFSERYDFIAETDDDAMSKCAVIQQQRANFLSQDWFIVATRLSELTGVNVSGKCKIVARRIILCPDISVIHGALGPADTPAAAVFVDQFFTGIKKPSHRQFRGIPDDWWDATALTGAREAINTFCRRLKTVGVVRFIATPTACDLSGKPLNCCALRRISSRRVGRPFGLIRGRRSKRKILP